MILQTLLWPNDKICNDKSMYYRIKGNTIFFNTYFNMISLDKWKEYTDIKSYALQVTVACKGSIQIYDQEKMLIQYQIANEGTYTIDIPIDKTKGCVYFTWTSDIVEEKSISARYITGDIPKNDIRIALNICTYMKEEYIKKNLEIIKRTIIDNPKSPIFDKIDIYIIDNGQTLKAKEIETDIQNHIHMHPNINTGGSGGFTRGIIEILKNKEKDKISHIIFMDDDIVIEPESLLRTYALLSYVNDKYKKASIAGAMLRADKKYIQHESGAVWNGLEINSLSGNIDLRLWDIVKSNEKFAKADYAAWWYACYPLSVINKNDLPLPLFIHMDDVEFGLRHPNGVMMLNGICVWHNTFENKRASALAYYDVRNAMILKFLYEKPFRQEKGMKQIIKLIVANIMRYRYKDISLIYEGVKDALKGPRYISSIDASKKHKEIINKGYKNIDIEKLKNNDNISIYNMGVWPTKLIGKKTIILEDPDTHKGIKLKKEIAKDIKSSMYIIEIWKMLKRKSKNVQKDYIDGINELRSLEYWGKSLELI